MRIVDYYKNKFMKPSVKEDEDIEAISVAKTNIHILKMSENGSDVTLLYVIDEDNKAKIGVLNGVPSYDFIDFENDKIIEEVLGCCEFLAYDSIEEALEKYKELEITYEQGKDGYINTFLEKYIEHIQSDGIFNRIQKKIKTLSIDMSQYDDMLSRIKENINKELNNLYENHINKNATLDTDRSYQEICQDLIPEEDFKKMFPYYEEILYGVDSISTNGYPRWMAEEGMERTYIRLAKMGNGNYLFQHNELTGWDEDIDPIYKIGLAIVSDKEHNTILDYWNEIQNKNEAEFEIRYMESVAIKRRREEESAEDELEGEM